MILRFKISKSNIKLGRKSLISSGKTRKRNRSVKLRIVKKLRPKETRLKKST